LAGATAGEADFPAANAKEPIGCCRLSLPGGSGYGCHFRPRETTLDRFTKLALVGLLIVIGIVAAQPYIDRYLLSGEPREITARADLTEAETTTIAIFEQAAPSVVQVVGGAPRGRTPIPGQNGSNMQTGTGFVWDEAGHVVTNHHVVEGASEVFVRLASGEMARATPVGTAPRYDLAVLHMADRRRLPPPAQIGTSSDLKVGQSAFAIGNPFGLDQTLTTGVISALTRRLPTSTGREIANVIQTDASINPGNSGGPLLDSAGRVIGVNTAIFSPTGTNTGIGFAIPIDTVNRIVPQIIAEGRVPTPGIGISAADETVSAQLGVQGVVIVSVVPGSPAEAAGLRGLNAVTGELGDVIVAVDGETVRRVPELTEALEEAGVGNEVELTILRDGSTLSVNLEVEDIGLDPS
jgi:2-alkenal reductase